MLKHLRVFLFIRRARRDFWAWGPKSLRLLVICPRGSRAISTTITLSGPFITHSQFHYYYSNNSDLVKMSEIPYQVPMSPKMSSILPPKSTF